MVQGDYYVPAAFVDKFAVHLVKNFLIDQNQLTGEVPLILGIWGGKGCGKTFMLELCCREMGITPIIMSAGELEDEWAGEPGTLIRNRYRRAVGKPPQRCRVDPPPTSICSLGFEQI